ncbi:hypothetical protein LHJ74_29715 [Streptomyces sp. N2-109]|uniref:Secreted protein n=1 Tax=Streptomyces gossypii TaxID=2883101 RepID=A0ABT2K3K2_9ACTN|nr:hypothetical protein [Streptomyces gossypii]MCT2594039.1 hypothetical protein [Streptomyces gossypii]
MPLRVPPAPTPALRSVLEALGSPAAPGAGSARPELALPVHEISRDGQQQGPPHTRLTGWRFLLRDTGTGGQAGAAEAKLSAEGWTFAHFSAGPYVTSTRRALDQAEALPLTYQPRLLSVPELYTLTLWLHGDAEADPAEGFPEAADLLIPLAPAPPGIAAHQPHRMDALLPLLVHRLMATPLLGTVV